MIAGALSEAFGRKRLLPAAAALFAITSLGNALAPNFTLFIAWRMLGGVAIGFASSLSPMYIAEVAPAHLRGRLVSINQLTIVIGILLAQFINWFIARNLPVGATSEFIVGSWFGQTCWRWMFGVTAIPSLLFLIGMFFVPESPRWLVTKGRVAEAFSILGKIGGAAYAQAAIAEINETLKNAQASVNFEGQLNPKLLRVPVLGIILAIILSIFQQWSAIFRELLNPKLRRVLVLGIVLAVFQQWCGINVIFNYAENIFKDAGYDISTVLTNIAWTGSVNLAFTFVALGVVDKLGRRPLMLLGAAGLGLVYLAMGFGYFTGVQGLPMLLLALAVIACFAMTLGPVTWVVISEIFPNRIRGAAMSVAVAALWGACFVLIYTFPILNKALGAHGTFWLYAAICAAGFLFILFRLPETKGKTLEQLEKDLVDK